MAALEVGMVFRIKSCLKSRVVDERPNTDRSAKEMHVMDW